MNHIFNIVTTNAHGLIGSEARSGPFKFRTMDRLDDEIINQVAQMLGEPDPMAVEAEIRRRFSMLWAICFLSRRYKAWYEVWCDSEMDIAFHW